MIAIDDVERFHNNLIDRFGGSKGIRDRIGLEAAINRPFATFDQQDLYPSLIQKAAAVFESLIINHPFVDGNKRIAFTMCDILLKEGKLNLNADEDEIYTFVISASTGEVRFDDIVLWLNAHIVSL